MKNWVQTFVEKHGERMFFLVAAIVMATVFYLTPDLRDTGKTILIGAAMLLFNKARSPQISTGEKPNEPKKE